ncbi:hypothetical protein LCGC14_2121280, partial [marine sediment metagenome]
YQPGADVEAFNGRVIEVKRRENPVSKQLEGWLEDVNLVAVRADRGEWHVWLTLSELLDLIEEGPDYEHPVVQEDQTEVPLRGRQDTGDPTDHSDAREPETSQDLTNG